MELRQLTYFVAVVEEASFTKAAAKLHVAQPGVSAQVRQLEREVGEQLLDRSGRTVRPTEAGLALLPYARAALAAVADAKKSVEELSGLVRGQVRVSTVGSVASVDLPELLAGFHGDHPDVDVTLTMGSAEQLAARLRTGEVDLVFVGTGAIDEGMATQVVADEPIVAVMGLNHPLRTSDVAVSALLEQSLICMPVGSGLRAAVEAACATEGFQPHVAFEATDPKVLVEFAVRGLGVALVAESMVRGRGADVVVRRIDGAPRVRMLMGWRGDGQASPAARALIRYARAALPDLSGGL